MKKDKETPKWEKAKNYFTYFISGIAFLLIVRICFGHEKSTFSRLNLDKLQGLPSQSADHLTDFSEYDSHCRWDTCFDIFNCTEINFYLYPLEKRTLTGKQITPKISKEFYQLYKAISASKYYTPNIENACLKIAPIDLLSQPQESQKLGPILHSLKHWNNGKNFIFFNFNNLDTDKLPIGEGVIASSSLDIHKYRFDYDLPISYYSSFLEPVTNNLESVNDEKLIFRRKFDILMIGHQFDRVNYQVERIQNEHYLEYQILILKPCLNQSQNQMCDKYENIVSVPEIFNKTKYCLITSGINGRFQSVFLAAALGSGCVPIITSETALLPYSGKIDWSSVGVRLSDRFLEDSLVKTLNKITPEDQARKREKCFYIYKRFFASMDAVLEGTIQLLADRIFPHKTSPYEHWNGPMGGVKSPMVLESIAPDTGFTAVILAYERIESLYRVIEGISKAPSIKKVLVIWNNQKKLPPPNEEWPKISVKIVIIKTDKNVLSNRFYPYDEIETDCVLSIDDDIVMLTSDEIEFGYQAWREFPDRLVGYPPRLHLLDEEQNNFKYNSEWTNEASIILTGGSFYHKYFSHAYSHLTPAHIRDWVDGHMNCEDILMNFVISNSTGKAPIKIGPRKKFKCIECSNQNSISIDPGHMVERSECINYFTKQYGKMPLKAVQFRADPVLYKDEPKKSDPVVKKYEDMGPL